MVGEDGNGLGLILDEIERAGMAGGGGDLAAMYAQIRPHLERLVAALSAEGGDTARIGGVIEHLMAGADAITTAPDVAKGDAGRVPEIPEGGEDAAGGVAGSETAAANSI